jgi:hypothetical protein
LIQGIAENDLYNAMLSLETLHVTLLYGFYRDTLEHYKILLRELSLCYRKELVIPDILKFVEHILTLVWLDLTECTKIDASKINRLKIVPNRPLLRVRHENYNQHHVFQPDTNSVDDGRLMQCDYNHAIDKTNARQSTSDVRVRWSVNVKSGRKQVK